MATYELVDANRFKKIASVEQIFTIDALNLKKNKITS